MENVLDTSASCVEAISRARTEKDRRDIERYRDLVFRVAANKAIDQRSLIDVVDALGLDDSDVSADVEKLRNHSRWTVELTALVKVRPDIDRQAVILTEDIRELRETLKKGERRFDRLLQERRALGGKTQRETNRRTDIAAVEQSNPRLFDPPTTTEVPPEPTCQPETPTVADPPVESELPVAEK